MLAAVGAPEVTVRQLAGRAPAPDLSATLEQDRQARGERIIELGRWVVLIFAAVTVNFPTPIAGEEYPGYPLLANASPALAWFLGGLPLLIAIAWWWSRRPPQIAAQLIKDGGQS